MSLEPWAEYAADWQPFRVEPVRSGLSGDAVWKIHAPAGAGALRRWAPGREPERIERIHRLLEGLRQKNFTLAPHPVADRQCRTLQWIAPNYWELCTWMPGRPAPESGISAATLGNIMKSLASLHRALEETFADDRQLCPTTDRKWETAYRQKTVVVPPAWTRREAEWKRLRPLVAAFTETERLEKKTRELFERTKAAVFALNESIERTFNRVAPTQLRPCLRDLHREHVLLDGDRVTGFVDFEAVGLDCVACDLARLLGSLVPDEPELWNGAFAAYDAYAPLSSIERELAVALDFTGTVVSGMRWAEWLAISPRPIAKPMAATRRWETLIVRLERWAASGPGVLGVDRTLAPSLTRLLRSPNSNAD